ncbi:MAG TPA: hypothetical protein VH915_00300 [Pedococcus sp.]
MSDDQTTPVRPVPGPPVPRPPAPSAAAPESAALEGTAPSPAAEPSGEPAPQNADAVTSVTGDAVIDAALQSLQEAPADDLDAQVAAGQRVHQTLQARLSDAGGE